MADPLPAAFYRRDPVTVANDLLGARLVRRTREGLVDGRIVEVEAYLASTDPACHTYRGLTPRNRVMFSNGGNLYVYAIHARYCLNVVTETTGIGSAVLIRALEPQRGIPMMQRRRRRDALLDLTRGPARLCEALDVDRRLDGWDLTQGRSIWIESASAPAQSIARSPRIGVTAGNKALLRFFLDGSRFVSGPRKWHSARPAGGSHGE